MPNPMQEQILDALKKVKFPGLSRDIVSFGFVRDVVVEGDAVSFTIHFQTENPPSASRSCATPRRPCARSKACATCASTSRSARRQGGRHRRRMPRAASRSKA
jgi:hypothetical protein